MIQSKPWEAYAAQPATVYGTPKPIDPYKAEDQQLQRDAAARAERIADRQDRTAQRGIEVQERAIGNKEYDNTLKLRGDYDALPAVKEYRIAVSQLAAGLKASPDATGDNALIYAYAKAMDPGSVVRESEMGMAASGASVVEAAAANLKKQFGIEGGGQLDPDIRDRLRREMLHKVTAIKAGYDQQRQRFTADAQAFGLDPARVIGNHDGDPFADEFRAYDESRRPQETGTVPEGAVDLGDVPWGAKAPTGGMWSQIGEATGNVVSGVGQGLAALPDMAANATGAVLALPADALGFDNVARNLRNPTTIGGMIERANPTPQDTVGAGVRMASQFGGGVAGFPQRAANAVTNAIVGQVPRQIPNALAPGGNAVMQSADALSKSVGAPIQPLAADVAGATTRRLTSVGAQLPLSARPIVNAAQRLTTQTQGARDTIAQRTGQALEPEMAGDTVKRGLGVYRTRTGQQARNMYQKAQEASDGVAIQPQSVLQTLSGHIDEQRAIPGGSDILPVLESLAADLTKSGQFSVEGVRGMRTVLSGRLQSAGLTPTNAQRIVNELVQAAGDDISNSLVKAGKPDAAKAYRSADKFYAERMEVINNAIKPIIGKNGEKSGEQVLQGLQQAAKGNTARLSQIMRVLPEEDAGTVRATIINGLGKSSAGAQNAEGSAFSLSQFLTHWNQLTPRAKTVLFDRGTLTDLNHLATVANGSKQAARFANSSNTGSVMGSLATGATLGVDLLTTAGTALAQIGGGWLLARPGFARWMARAPSNPKAIGPHIARLSTVATQNPAAAGEIKALQQFLSEAFEQSPGRLAAGQDER